jgi:hypothetical protein
MPDACIPRCTARNRAKNRYKKCGSASQAEPRLEEGDPLPLSNAGLRSCLMTTVHYPRIIRLTRSCVNAVRQWRVPAAKGSGAVDILFAARPSGNAMPTTRDAASARMGKERMALGYSKGLRPGYGRTSPYDIWVEGRYSGFDDGAACLGRDGHVGVLYVGGDYRVAENMMVGALVQFDWSKDASDVLQSSVDGNGGMAGPYLSMRVAPPSGTASAPPTTPATPCGAPSTSRSTDGGVTPRAHHPSEQSVKTNATSERTMPLTLRTQLVTSAVLAAFAFASPAHATLPSGCSGINGAPYPLQSTSTPPQLLLGVTNLQIGDRITITANGLPSTGMQLQDSLGNIVLQFGAISSTPQTRQFTVSNAAESTLYAYSTLLSVSGPYRVVVSSASCTAPSPSNASQGPRERLPCGAHQRPPAQ